MIVIEEIDKSLFDYKPDREKLSGVMYPQYFYKVDVFGIDFYLDSAFDKEQFVLEQINDHFLLCADNRIAVFSPNAQLVVILRVFEIIYMFRDLKNSFYLFSERIAFKFSKADYSIENMLWLSDLIVDIEEQPSGFKIICFDSSVGYI